MTHHDRPDSAGDVFRQFAMACRAERDRLALVRLAREDKRFDSAIADRADAAAITSLAIASAKR